MMYPSYRVGADVNAQRGRPLVQAATFGHVELCRLLLDVTPPLEVAAMDESLVAACRKGFAEVVEVLLCGGARAEAGLSVALSEAMAADSAAAVKLLIRVGGGSMIGVVSLIPDP